jgi:hypothetical protein
VRPPRTVHDLNIRLANINKNDSRATQCATRHLHNCFAFPFFLKSRPDWRLHMTTRSTFGDQPSSVKASAPSFGFGTASREQAGKVFVSQEHTALATAGTQSPGPAVYLLPASVGGKQPDGRKADPPVWGFGTAQRFRPKTAPQKPDGRHGNNPGPGYYGIPPASVGPQVLARFGSAPLVGFGTAERKNVRKVFISQEHQKTDLHGFDSPGPAAPYTLRSTVGKQESSAMKSPPAWVFGAASRVKDQPGLIGPGPAGYTLPQSVGPQPDSRKPRASTPGFGASTREIRAGLCTRAHTHRTQTRRLLSPRKRHLQLSVMGCPTPQILAQITRRVRMVNCHLGQLHHTP